MYLCLLIGPEGEKHPMRFLGFVIRKAKKSQFQQNSTLVMQMNKLKKINLKQSKCVMK